MKAANRFLAALCALFAFALMAAPLHAEDSRFEIQATNEYKLFNSVGMVREVDESDPEHGTGFLVSSCHVLTNYHVAFGSDTAMPVSNKKVRFSLGVAGDADLETFAGRVVGYGEDFLPTKNRYDDWALIRLGANAGDKYGHFNMASTPFPAVSQLELLSAGFPADKPASALWGDICRIPDRERYGWITNCILVPGSSGGPITTRNQRGEYVVIGMNSGFHVNRGMVSKSESRRDKLNIATPIYNLYDRVQALMKANPCDERPVPGMTASAGRAG